MYWLCLNSWDSIFKALHVGRWIQFDHGFMLLPFRLVFFLSGEIESFPARLPRSDNYFCVNYLGPSFSCVWTPMAYRLRHNLIYHFLLKNGFLIFRGVVRASCPRVVDGWLLRSIEIEIRLLFLIPWNLASRDGRLFILCPIDCHSPCHSQFAHQLTAIREMINVSCSSLTARGHQCI